MTTLSNGLHLFKRQQVLPKGAYWQIHEGLIRSVTWDWDQDADLITLGVWGPGDILGSQLSGLSLFELECQTDVLVEVVDPAQLDLHALQTAYSRVNEQMLNITRSRRTDIRLGRLLEWLAQRFGTPEADGFTINRERVHLTHCGLADLNGSTRATVTRLLQSFRDQGAIAYPGRRTMCVYPALLPHRSHSSWLRVA